MFDTALVIIDKKARPILIIPEELPKGKPFLKIVNGGVDIGVDDKILGKVRNIDEASLALLGLQDAVGMSTFKGNEGEEMPDKIQYVADVTETRLG